jgi:hypothetical protein
MRLNLKTTIKILRKCKILIQIDLLDCLTYSGVGGQSSKSLWINRLRLRRILIAVLRLKAKPKSVFMIKSQDRFCNLHKS